MPGQSLTGWEIINDSSCMAAKKMPKVSHGTMYHYLSSGAGRAFDSEGKTFQALYRGFNHWASGRVNKIEVNNNNPLVCFVRCTVHEAWSVQSKSCSHS